MAKFAKMALAIMRLSVLVCVFLAGCASSPTDVPVETIEEPIQEAPGLADLVDNGFPAQEWNNCETMQLTVSAPADRVEVPSNLHPVPGALPNTVAYTVWAMACGDNTAGIGFVNVEEGGFVTWMRSDDLPLATEQGATMVALFDGAQISPLNVRSAMGAMRASGNTGIIGHPSHSMDATGHPTDPPASRQFNVTFHTEDGAALNAITEFAEYHAIAGQIAGQGLPWDGVLPGTGYMQAGGALVGNDLTMVWS